MKFSSILIFCCLLISACNNSTTDNSNTQNIAVDSNDLSDALNYNVEDPFLKNLKSSEYFKISGLEDNIVETQNGIFLSIPKGIFRDASGNIVEREIDLEILDIDELEEQLLLNISDDGKGRDLETQGLLYINASANGQKLSIDQESAIYVEIPSQNASEDLLVFEGVRNEDGEIAWLEQPKPRKFLTPMDLGELDFLPENFALTVQKYMPYKSHTIATNELVDSIYYSCSSRQFLSERTDDIEIPVIKLVSLLSVENGMQELAQQDTSETRGECSFLDPAIVKLIKSEKYQNTFIATKQFETRLKYIHTIKEENDKLVEVYIKSLDQDLAYCDSLIASYIPTDHPAKTKFQSFAKENYGNVEDLPRGIKKLGQRYSENLKKVQNDLETKHKEYQKLLEKKSKEAEEKKAEYKELLVKRQNYRLEKFGFSVKKLGYVKIAKIIEQMEKFELHIDVEDGASYDRAYVYTVDSRINSIFALTSKDEIHFDGVHKEDKYLLYLKKQTAQAVVVAYKDEVPYYDQESFVVNPVIELTLSPKKTDDKALKKTLKNLNRGHNSPNKILVDLEYQAAFEMEKVRQKKLDNEMRMYRDIYFNVFNCEYYGEY